jgi:Fe-Mn family superoxide dismutase
VTGWAWLSWDPASSKLVVDKTIGAGNPMTDGKKPLLTMDVWEHAYYLGSSHPCFGPQRSHCFGTKRKSLDRRYRPPDYQNLRPNYIKAFLDKLINWEFVAANLAAAK